MTALETAGSDSSLVLIVLAFPLLAWSLFQVFLVQQRMSRKTRREDIYVALLAEASLSGHLYTASAMVHAAERWERLKLRHQRKLRLIAAGFTPDDARTDLVRELDDESLALLAALRGARRDDFVIDLRDM